VPKRERWHPPPYDTDDIRAIQACVQGAASSDDQKRAIDWIVNVACGTYDEPFLPGQPDVRDYLIGRRSVGLAIVKLMKLRPSVIGADDAKS
jgi:hypothetical protein